MTPTVWQWTRPVALAATLALGVPAEAQERMEWAWDPQAGSRMIPVRVVGDTVMINDMILGSWRQIDTYGLADWQPARLKSPVTHQGGNRPARLWHGVDVPFDFDASYSAEGRAIVRQAIALYRLQSGIRFTPRTEQTDYILFTRSNHECTSSLGKVGKAQPIAMNESCMVSLTDTLHFMGHALGLGHVHQREPAHLNSVSGYPAVGSMSSRLAIGWQSPSTTRAREAMPHYDLTSVMHYDPHWREGWDLRPVQDIHARQLSEGDISQLAVLYPRAARDARQQSAPRTWQTGRLKVPGTDQCLGYSPADALVLAPHVVHCGHQTARWTWDNHQRLKSGHEFNRCLDLDSTRTPRVKLCSASSIHPWQYRNNTLVHNGLTLMRDANNKIVAHDQSETSRQRLKAGHSQLWQWVPESQP